MGNKKRPQTIRNWKSHNSKTHLGDPRCINYSKSHTVVPHLCTVIQVKEGRQRPINPNREHFLLNMGHLRVYLSLEHSILMTFRDDYELTHPEMLRSTVNIMKS